MLVLLFSTAAYITIGASSLRDDYAGFIIALFGTFLIGISFALGELTMLGMFVKYYG